MAVLDRFSAEGASLTSAPADERASNRFSGWRILGWSTFLIAASAPGQTAAISVFIDPMIAELGITRSVVSTAYLIGTLTGAAAMPFIGRALDRHGARRVLIVVALVFAAALCGLSAVSGVFGLTAGFVAVRMAGQGALTLAATTVIALWFQRKRGTALGISGAIGTSLISLTPVLMERVISEWGWRTAWLAEGIFVAVLVVPVAWFAIRDRPSDVGQFPDGAVPDADTPAEPEWGATRAQALRTPYFWVLTAAVASIGMLVTAVNFHQISLLTDHGLTTVEAASNFIPQTAATLAGTFAAGYLTDRIAARYLVVAAMALLGVALAVGTVVSSGLVAIAFGVLVGAAGGAVRGFEAATFAHYFGTLHIGAIRGVVTAVSVAGTAFGPVLFATVRDFAGGYTPALLGSIAIPAAVLAAALIVRPPAGAWRDPARAVA